MFASVYLMIFSGHVLQYVCTEAIGNFRAIPRTRLHNINVVSMTERCYMMFFFQKDTPLFVRQQHALVSGKCWWKVRMLKL
ncbi:hypothetical protein YC2023_118046 [Brassica napus]